MSSQWYVLSCKLGREQSLWKLLQAQGYEVFYPFLLTPQKSRVHLEQEAFFPGYLFIRLDLKKDKASTLKWRPDSEGLVYMGGQPTYVPDPIIQAIHMRLVQVNELVSAASEPGTKEKGGLNPETHAIVQGTIFDMGLTTHERVQALLKMLQGLSLSPQHKAD